MESVSQGAPETTACEMVPPRGKNPEHCSRHSGQASIAVAFHSMQMQVGPSKVSPGGEQGQRELQNVLDGVRLDTPPTVCADAMFSAVRVTGLIGGETT